jgi:hypothetical protein
VPPGAPFDGVPAMTEVIVRVIKSLRCWWWA